MSIDESQYALSRLSVRKRMKPLLEGFQSSLEGEIQAVCSFGGGADMESVIS